MTFFLELLALAGLILLNAFFVAAEYGLVTSRRTRILELERDGNRRARRVRKITSDPPQFISAMQLGVTITSLAIGAVGEPVLSHAFEPVVATVLAVIFALLIITYLHVVLGELVPKGIALSRPERTALALSTAVSWFFIVFKPLIWLLRRSTEAVLGALGFQAGAQHEAHSEAELRMLLTSSAEQGEIEADEEEMLSKVFDFANKDVSNVMVPRPDVVALSVDLPPEECLQAVLDSPYTRYPVYRETLDDIVGVLHVRDLIEAMHERGGIAHVDIAEIIRPATMVPETKDLADLLTEFRLTRGHLAIVLDEYGTVAGIVTLEDLLEEIVGEIEDEFDIPEETVERVDEDTVRIDGTLTIDDFNETFGVSLPDEDFNTVGGFVFGALGRGAEPGDEVRHDGMVFHVDSVDGQRIDRLTVTFVHAHSHDGEPAPD